MRFERCQKNNVSLFRPFEIRKPYQSAQDIFCLRVKRMVNGYRKISIGGMEMRIPSAPLHDYVEVRISHDSDGTSVLRIWHDNTLLETRTVKTENLKN